MPIIESSVSQHFACTEQGWGDLHGDSVEVAGLPEQ